MLLDENEEKLTKYSIKSFNKYILPHITKNRKAKILDVGCGYGRYIKALNDNGYENVYGIDISQEQIDYAKNNMGLKNVEIYDALDFLKYKKDEYEVILLLDILEHLEIEQSILLIKLCYESMKDKGVLIIQVPNAFSPLSIHRHSDLTHKRAYTIHSIRQSLLLGGFTKINQFHLPIEVHGLKSLIRRSIWSIIINPLISLYMLVVGASLRGGIYTPNLLTIAKK